MASFIPAPTKPTSLQAGSSGTPLTGTVPILGGLGIKPSTSGNGIALDGLNSSPAEAGGLFIPGVLAADSAAAVFNLSDKGGQRAYLRFIEVNARVAATAADTTNYMKIRVAGATSGALELPLTDTNRHHALDQFFSTPLGANEATAASSGAASGTAIWQTFTVSSAAHVGAVGFGLKVISGSPTCFVRLWDPSTGAVLATSDSAVITDPFGSDNSKVNHIFTLDKAVDLAQGHTYIAQLVQSTADLYPCKAGANTGVLATVGPAENQTGSDAVLPAAGNSTAWAGNGSIVFGLYGVPGGSVLVGSPVTVSVVAVGTGGSPGSDHNIRFSWSLS